MIVTILLGILGLGIVVFVHELGHFLAAKASGIEVEAFSIGWGKVLVSKKWRGTDYRISLLPFGGYCKMKGEELFKKALDEKADKIPDEQGSLFSVPVWKRTLTYAAGPFFNFLFAVLVLAVIWFVGFSLYTFENRVLLLSDYPNLFGSQEYPADQAGLRSGDRIIEIDGEEVTNYLDIQQQIAQSARESIPIKVDRGGRVIGLEVTPELNPETGAGRIGVTAWIEPTIGTVEEGKSAAIAGLQRGDRILEVNDLSVEHSIDFYSILNERPSKLRIRLQREGEEHRVELIPLYNEEGQAEIGMSFQGIEHRNPGLGPGKALVRGAEQAVETFALTIKGIAALFSGVDVQKAVSGPVRITYMVGEIASQGFAEGMSTGLISLFRFLSLLSVALCFGNLLPIPALDGGLILLSVVEMVKGSSVSPRTFYRYQTVGFVIIIAILFLTTFSDISFFFSR